MRPVKVPPTEYLAPIRQPTIAATTVRAIIHANVFTFDSPVGGFGCWDTDRLKSFKKIS
jgi:hypothetical protein